VNQLGVPRGAFPMRSALAWIGCAALLVSGCAGRVGPLPAEPLPQGVFLPHDAYLQALDSSAAHVRVPGRTVFYHSQDGSDPISTSDLRRLRVLQADGPRVCRGQAVLRFRPAVQLADGTRMLEVVEATDQSGLAGSHAYFFRCEGRTCRMAYSGHGNGDYLVAC
jgi:hypothetical protein